MSYERAAEVASKAAYTSSGATAMAGFTLNEVAMVVGIIATIVTLAINWYYKQKHYELARNSYQSTDDE